MRLIDADVFERHLMFNATDEDVCDDCLRYVLGEMRTIPTVDAVEVVRCKDCVYCEKSYRGLHCDIVGDNLLPDFYCACGERKEDKWCFGNMNGT